MKKLFVVSTYFILSFAQQILAQSFEIESVANIRGCSTQQANAIRSAELAVASRLQFVMTEFPKFNLEYVHQNFLIPTNRPFTSGSKENQNYEIYLQKMLSVFSRMQNATQSGVNFECKDSNDEPQCQNGEVMAYVLFYGAHADPNMYLCSGYFAANHGDADRVETMFHELSHYAADTDDLALSWLSPKNFQILRAPDDAYHIQNFSAGLIQDNLRRQIWFWNWPK